MKYTVTSKYSGNEGAYVSVIPDARSVKTINNFFISNLRNRGLEEFILPHNDMHITVIYSRNNAPDPAKLPYLQPEAKIKGVIANLQVWPGHDGKGYIVAGIRSPALAALNKFWRNRGCASDWEDYHPHLTLASGFLEGGGTLSSDVTLFLKQCNKGLREAPLKITLFGHRIEDVS